MADLDAAANFDQALLAHGDGPVGFQEAAMVVAISALESHRPHLAEAVLALALDDPRPEVTSL